MQIPTHFERIAISRRGLIAASAGAALALRCGGMALAQDAAAPAAKAEVPAGAAAWLKYNLNTAAEDQLVGIPGAGERMTREFLEYRPYTSIGQFRGEIGKYISPEEVAALETYLFVPVDANQADADTLQQLPGVNADVAQALIAGRPYDSVDHFLAAFGGTVDGELLTAAATFLTPNAGETATWLKYNLNTASDEQLMGIPGAGERMTREFTEYRPYTSIGQFRGEIGKYVGPEEVAALEKYLFVPVDPNQADVDTLRQLPGVSADLAQTLSGNRPYDSVDAFLAALSGAVSPELAAVAQSFVEGA